MAMPLPSLQAHSQASFSPSPSPRAGVQSGLPGMQGWAWTATMLCDLGPSLNLSVPHSCHLQSPTGPAFLRPGCVVGRTKAPLHTLCPPHRGGIETMEVK